MKEKAIALAKKLYELVKRGEGGEKEAAKFQLDKLMEKHGITYDDIEDEVKHGYIFLVSLPQFNLFWQIVKSILGKDYRVWRFKRFKEPQKYEIEMTAAQAVELQAKFDFYGQLFKEEIDALHYAFYLKHNIFTFGEEAKELHEFTPEEREFLVKSQRMAKSLENKSFQKRIGKNETKE